MNAETHPGRTQLTDADETRLTQLAAGERPATVIVIGVGDESLLEAIFERLPETKVLTLEPLPAVARRLLAQPPIARRIRAGRLVVLVGPEYAGATDAWRLFGDVAGMPPTFVEAGLEGRRDGDIARAKVEAAKIVLGAKQNAAARKKFAGPYLLNTLTNSPAIARESNVTTLFDLMTDVPAIVVAAGPSLDRNIEDLKMFAGGALIVAVDTAVRPLLTAGIQPHLAVSVDPSETNARHLQDLPDPQGIALVAEGSLYPTALAPFTGRTFIYHVSQHHPWPWLASQGVERGALQAWGSVLTTTFDLVCRLGCNPIVFAGADLAFTRRLLYCRNTTYEAGWSHLATDAERVEFFERGYFTTQPTTIQPDIHGADTLCTTPFIQFRDWLVARANTAADRRIVNATGGGILHGGRILQSDLKTILGELPDGRIELRQRLTAAWKKGFRPDTETTVKRGLEQIVAQRGEELQRWIDFGKDTVSADDIVARLTFAGDALAAASRGQVIHWRETARVHTSDVDSGSNLQTAERERDAARHARDEALLERDAARRERDAALAVRDALVIERAKSVEARDAALAASDTALTARDAGLARADNALVERDAARHDRDAAIAACEALVVKYNAALATADAALAERDAALTRADAALATRDTALIARDAALARGDSALIERDAARKDRDTAIAACAAILAKSNIALAASNAELSAYDTALALRDAALATADAALAERDAALTRADVALAARDASLAERDEARAARDQASTERDQALGLRAGAPADHAITDRYLSDLREFYDSCVTDLQSAQSLSHGHYDIASRRAASQQTFVLMDFMQRTYSPAGMGIRPSLTAASILPERLRVLDIGCGVGRQMVPLAEAGIQVDGVDISPRMIDFARADARLAASQFFLGSGRDCGAAPVGAYDLVYSQLLFRWVCSRSVRRMLLQAMAQALRPGGVVVVETRLFPKLTANAVTLPQVPWSAEWNGDVPAGHSEVQLTPDELDLVLADFSNFFDDVRLQIVDAPVKKRDRLPPQLLISGAVNGSLTQRIHALSVAPAES